MRRADYQVVNVKPDAVYLVDLDWGNVSVTNDAENVVRDIYNRYGNVRIIYRDSDRRWDELTHINGEFTGYQALPKNQWPEVP